MDWQIGDIATVDEGYDSNVQDCLFYLTDFSNDTAVGFLRNKKYEQIDYSCPLSKLNRIARVITWKTIPQ